MGERICKGPPLAKFLDCRVCPLVRVLDYLKKTKDILQGLWPLSSVVGIQHMLNLDPTLTKPLLSNTREKEEKKLDLAYGVGPLYLKAVVPTLVDD